MSALRDALLCCHSSTDLTNHPEVKNKLDDLKGPDAPDVPCNTTILDPSPQAPRKCFLLDLPHEILHLICDELLGVAGKEILYQVRKKTRDMCHLLRTCRTLYHVVLPKLHRTVICIHQRHAAISCNVDQPRANTKKILNALCAFQDNREAGGMVQTMILGHTNPNPPSLMMPAPPELLKRCSSHFYRMFGWPGEPSKHVLCDRVGMYMLFCATVATMALVCSTPNLAVLHISFESGCTDFLLNKLDNGQIAGPKFTLPFLTTLYVDHPSNTRSPSCCIASLDGLLHSTPNLATLRINCGYKSAVLTASLPQLTMLSLLNAHLSAADLKHLVRASTQLVDMRLIHGAKRIGVLPVSPRRALDALQPARLTLRRLALLTWMPEDGRIKRNSRCLLPLPPLGPRETFPLLDGVRLADLFPALEQVCLDARAVTGLPDLLAGMERLEGLTLANVRASGQFEEEIETMLGRVRMSEWPRLRSVRLRSYRPANGAAPQTAWEGLRAMLENLGWKKVSERQEVGVVVAGVSFLALSTLEKMKIFTDIPVDSDE